MPRTRSRGFTLIELLVVIAIIAVLLGILIPAISAVQTRSGAVKCVSNLGNIAVSMGTYCKDNRNYFPVSATVDWDVDDLLLSTMSNSKEVFECPLDAGDSVGGVASRFSTSGTSYRYLDNSTFTNMFVNSGIAAVEGHRTTEFRLPSKKVVAFDTPLSSDRTASDSRNRWHSSSDPLRGSLGYVDGHAEDLKKKGTASTSYSNATAAELLTLSNETYY